ncbi:MAG: glutamine synthetase family protein [bacterium]
MVKARGVKFIRIWFVDIAGQLKSFSITDNELEGAFAEGMGFDGSSIEGFARIEESDLVAVPDPSTFAILPWRPEEHAVGRMFCDILTPDGKPYPGDTRHVLKRNLAEAAARGYTLQVGPELEYFYFKDDTAPTGLDTGGYFDTVPLDDAEDLRRQSILYLERMGIQVEYSHHEVAPSQHEIDLRHTEALAMADRVMTYKVVVKQVAHSAGKYASFMPKPVAWINGSGMHVHMSLFAGGRNAFFAPKDPFHLSPVARQFLAGVLHHARGHYSGLQSPHDVFRRLLDSPFFTQAVQLLLVLLSRERCGEPLTFRP